MTDDLGPEPVATLAVIVGNPDLGPDRSSSGRIDDPYGELVIHSVSKLSKNGLVRILRKAFPNVSLSSLHETVDSVDAWAVLNEAPIPVGVVTRSQAWSIIQEAREEGVETDVRFW